MNDTTTLTELDELKDLLQHPGYLRLQQHAEGEWGSAAYVAKMDGALKTIPEGPDQDAAATSRIYQLRGRRDEVMRLIAWPHERIKQIAEQKAQPKSRFAHLMGAK